MANCYDTPTCTVALHDLLVHPKPSAGQKVWIFNENNARSVRRLQSNRLQAFQIRFLRGIANAIMLCH